MKSLFCVAIAVLVSSGWTEGLCQFTRTLSAAEPTRIVMVGDSTMATYLKPPADRPDLTGWGQVFGEHFENTVVLNHASSGRSSKSFLAEGRWEKALADRPDFVFIQFGHNDGSGKGDRSTDPNGDFRDNLRKYLTESRGAGAVPVLVTPVAVRSLVNGKVTDRLGPYVTAVLEVARESETAVIDLHAASVELYEKLGEEAGSVLNPSPKDRTHFSREGAKAIARLVADRIPMAVPKLAERLKPSVEPASPAVK
jgi:lysophospholipase L1-like esterase